MTEEKEKKVDNLSYKERFQFVLSVNDNIICQRYFKINGFNRDSLTSIDLKNQLDNLVGLIMEDLKSKSIDYIDCTTPSTRVLLTGSYGEPDATYIECGPVTDEEMVADPILNPYEVTFKFEFIVDEKSVYSRIWDGTVYPKYVRNGVDITNSDASYRDKNPDELGFNLNLIRQMTIGRDDLIGAIINGICDVCGNSYTKDYDYVQTLEYGDTVYSTTPERDYIDSWYQATKQKTRDYFYRK